MVDKQYNKLMTLAKELSESEQKPLNYVSHQQQVAPYDGHMYVSFYYLPQMVSEAEAKWVRQALIPLENQLLEHHIDLATRHLTLYHYGALPAVEKALQHLNLGAALQQTLGHFEPLETTADSSTSFLIPQKTTQNLNESPALYRFMVQPLKQFRQWIERKVKSKKS